MDPYVPRPQRGASVRAGLFRKDEFRYDPESDSVLCPGSQRLRPYAWTVQRGLQRINYANRQACRVCALRPRCTVHTYRNVTRFENEAVLDRMEARMARRPDILSRRRELERKPVQPESACLPDAEVI